MRLLKKFGSVFGSKSEPKEEEPSALDSIRKLKEDLGMSQGRKDKDDEGWV